MTKKYTSSIKVLDNIELEDLRWSIFSENDGKTLGLFMDFYGPVELRNTNLHDILMFIAKETHDTNLLSNTDWDTIRNIDVMSSILNVAMMDKFIFSIEKQVDDFGTFYLLTLNEYVGEFTSLFNLLNVFTIILYEHKGATDTILYEHKGITDEERECIVEGQNLREQNNKLRFPDSNADVQDEPYVEDELQKQLEESGEFNLEDELRSIEEEYTDELDINMLYPYENIILDFDSSHNLDISTLHGIESDKLEDWLMPEPKESKTTNENGKLKNIADDGYTVSIDVTKDKVVAFFEKEGSERIGICSKTLDEALDMFYTMTGRVV